VTVVVLGSSPMVRGSQEDSFFFSRKNLAAGLSSSYTSYLRTEHGTYVGLATVSPGGSEQPSTLTTATHFASCAVSYTQLRIHRRSGKPSEFCMQLDAGGQGQHKELQPNLPR
jgi:hypothetical protein